MIENQMILTGKSIEIFKSKKDLYKQGYNEGFKDGKYEKRFGMYLLITIFSWVLFVIMADILGLLCY